MNNNQENGMKLLLRYQGEMLRNAPRGGGEFYQRKFENLGRMRKIKRFWN